MFSLFRKALGYPVRRSRESAFAMLPLVHKQAIPSRCGVGYTAPFEEGRYFTTEAASDCYESHKQGLLSPRFIWVIRDIIRSCLDKYRRGILTASSARVRYNGFSHYLDDGTDPIIPVGGIGKSGGLYVLLEGVLDFNDQHPTLAVLFFGELMKVNSYDALHRLLDDLYVKGVISRVRSIGQLYQAVSNFAPYGTFYTNAYDASLDYWETGISRKGEYTSIRVTVESLINNIPVKHTRDALHDFRKRRPENYDRNDISSCIACMRQGSEHCNQLGGPKRRVSNPLTMKEAIWGLNEAFHLVYPFSQSFLNENRHHVALDPTYFSGLWEEIK